MNHHVYEEELCFKLVCLYIQVSQRYGQEIGAKTKRKSVHERVVKYVIQTETLYVLAISKTEPL